LAESIRQRFTVSNVQCGARRAANATCASVNGFCMLSRRLAKSCSQYDISRNMLKTTRQHQK